MSSIFKEIENILIATMIKQSKYKYKIITEKNFNKDSKEFFNSYEITKYHIELTYDEELDKNKKIKVQDEKVRGKLVELLNYALEQYNEVVT